MATEEMDGLARLLKVEERVEKLEVELDDHDHDYEFSKIRDLEDRVESLERIGLSDDPYIRHLQNGGSPMEWMLVHG